VSGSSPTRRARKSWPSAVGRRHRDARGAGIAGGAGDVAIGQDEPVGRQHDARTGPAARPLLATASRRRGRSEGMDGKADHGRADAVDDVDHRARIGVEERLVFFGNRKPVGCGGGAPAQAGVTKGYNLHGKSPCLAGIDSLGPSRAAHMATPPALGTADDSRCN